LPHASQAFVLALVVASACKASVNAEAKMGVGEEETATDIEEPLASASTEGPIRAAEPAGDAAPALLGARPDLRLAPGKQTKMCRCLALAAGVPSDPAFLWEAQVPAIDPDTELVIAFSSVGAECADEPKDSLGASYWGYQTRAQDVVVLVECARSGRPVTTGAIIPRPAEGGHVYVRPVDVSVPYARADKDSQAACELNLPGR